MRQETALNAEPMFHPSGKRKVSVQLSEGDEQDGCTGRLPRTLPGTRGAAAAWRFIAVRDS